MRAEISSEAAAFSGFASSSASSPRPSTTQLLSPGRAETHPDLHWGATSLIRPSHQRDQLRSPAVGAYPPSPEDDVRSPLNLSVAAASSSRGGAPWMGSSATSMALSPHVGAEAWPPRPVDTLPSYGHESPLSPRLLPSSSADHYRAPRSSRFSPDASRSLWQPPELSRCKTDAALLAHGSLETSLAEETAGVRGSPGKCSSVGATSRLPSPRPLRTLL
jgi:hypothetical protein